MRRAKAVSAVNARRAGQRFPNYLMSRIVGRVWAPGTVVARPKDGDHRRANRGRDVNHAAVIRHDQSTPTHQRAKRLRAGCRGGDAGDWSNALGDVLRKLLFIGLDAAEDNGEEAVTTE